MGMSKLRPSIANDQYLMDSISTEEHLEYKAMMGYK